MAQPRMDGLNLIKDEGEWMQPQPRSRLDMAPERRRAGGQWRQQQAPDCLLVGFLSPHLSSGILSVCTFV